MRRSLIILCCLAAAFLSGSCLQQIEDPYRDFSGKARMTLRGELLSYDAPATKAAAALTWNPGARIYVRAKGAGNNIVTGVAEYNGEWSFSYRGNLVDFVGTVQCYYFEKDYNVNNYGVTLSHLTPIYEDAEATITADGNGGVLLTTYLKPKTGRVCFGKNLPEGATKTIASITGLSYYTSFDLKNFTLTTASAPITQYVTSPDTYFYGFFTDAENRTLTIRNMGIDFQRSFSEGVMQKGKSGYLNLPTYDAHENWEMLNYQDVETTDFTVNGVSFRMVSVPGGTFNMGGDAYSYSVSLNTFLMGQTEVTQELWQAVMGSNPANHQGEGWPADYVSWMDCQEFIYRLNALTGRQFRLPTEAEWEYAARSGGVDAYLYSGGDVMDDVAWSRNNTTYDGPHPVATLAPNSLGLFDMSGNVREWCEDWIDGYDDPHSYPYGAYEDPRGPKFGGGIKANRGGSYESDLDKHEVFSRMGTDMWGRHDGIGLRLVLSSIAEPVPEPVDMGLSVQWGSMNLGAWCPEDGGDFFAWGEVFPKGEYGGYNYKWMTDGYISWYGINKYTFPDGQTIGVWYNGDSFIGDNKRVLDLEDDPVWNLLGAPWRMPTQEEWVELLNSCFLSWEYRDNGQGFSVNGSNGNSFFLPSGSGKARDYGMENLMNTSYFASSSLGNGVDYSTGLEIAGGSYYNNVTLDRIYGYSVRPVYDPTMLTALSVIPGTLDVGNVICGLSTQLDFKVRNNTRETVTFSIEDLPTGFSVSPVGTATLGPGQSQQMTLTFAPMSGMEVDTQIRVSSAALDTPLYVSLKGTGVDAGVVTTYTANGVAFNMVSMPAGSFMMGREAYTSTPIHRVSLSSFQIGQTEVTQELWEAVMGYNPSYHTGDPKRPVENVSWYEVQSFIFKLNSLTGMCFRLPTEAEWEYAAREAGTSDVLYAGADDLDEIAWYLSNSSDDTHPVAQKRCNAVGLYDMCGNVWEWLLGAFYTPYDEGDAINPRGAAYGDSPNHRGGCYNSVDDCRVTYRGSSLDWTCRREWLGFRLVLGEPVAPEAVDLGLSVKWASFNIGACRPSEMGYYFAWGETSPRVPYYDWSHYQFMLPGGSDYTQINKYTIEDGFTGGSWYEDPSGTFVGDNKRTLDTEDDAAHVILGGAWRMPTLADFQELMYNCTWTRELRDGIYGMLVTGPSGASIFLPSAGYFAESTLWSINSYGYYLTSEIGDITAHMTALFFYDWTCSYSFSEDRMLGCPIRAVCP